MDLSAHVYWGPCGIADWCSFWPAACWCLPPCWPAELGTEFIPRLSEHAIVIATQRLAERFAGRIGSLRHADRKAAAGQFSRRDRSHLDPHRHGRNGHRSDGLGSERRVHHAHAVDGLAAGLEPGRVGRPDANGSGRSARHADAVHPADRTADQRNDRRHSRRRGGEDFWRRFRSPEPVWPAGGRRAARDSRCGRRGHRSTVAVAGRADRGRRGRDLPLRHRAARRAGHGPGLGHSAGGRNPRGSTAVSAWWSGWPSTIAAIWQASVNCWSAPPAAPGCRWNGWPGSKKSRPPRPSRGVEQAAAVGAVQRPRPRRRLVRRRGPGPARQAAAHLADRLLPLRWAGNSRRCKGPSSDWPSSCRWRPC